MTGFDIAVGLKINSNWTWHHVDLTGYLELDYIMYSWNNTVMPAKINPKPIKFHQCTEKDARSRFKSEIYDTDKVGWLQ